MWLAHGQNENCGACRTRFRSVFGSSIFPAHNRAPPLADREKKNLAFNLLAQFEDPLSLSQSSFFFECHPDGTAETVSVLIIKSMLFPFTLYPYTAFLCAFDRSRAGFPSPVAVSDESIRDGFASSYVAVRRCQMNSSLRVLYFFYLGRLSVIWAVIFNPENAPGI